MTKLETLEQEIYDDGIALEDVRGDDPRLGGDPARIRLEHGRATIYIDRALPRRDRTAFLAHELGHAHTLWKSEHAAWKWAFEYLLPRPLLERFIYSRETDAEDTLELPLWFILDAAAHYHLGKTFAIAKMNA